MNGKTYKLRICINRTLTIPRNNLAILCASSNNIYPEQNASFTEPFKVSVRTYAKSKDKKKEKGKGKVHINETQISELIDVEDYKNNMQQKVEKMKEDFEKNLSLRSTTGTLESLSVNVDGNEHTLQELAQIVRKNPKTIVLNMAVFPQAIPAALKAIQKSGLNLNPQQEGTTLYIPVPKVTKEHREGLAKNAKTLFIKCRDAIKDVQNKHVKSVKRQEGVSQDLQRSVEQQLIAIADTFVAEADQILVAKQTELLGKE